jgi:hypothetical protein
VRFPGDGSLFWHSLYAEDGFAAHGRGASIVADYRAAQHDPTPAFIRGGSILPVHGNTTPTSLELCRDYATDLVVVTNGVAPASARGFGYFDDQRDGLITDGGTFAHLEYSATVAAGGLYGSVSSVLRSEPPPALRFGRAFQSVAAVTVVFNLASSQPGTAETPRAVKQCLVNGTFACRVAGITATSSSGPARDVTTVALRLEITGAQIDATSPFTLWWSTEPATPAPTTPVPLAPTASPSTHVPTAAPAIAPTTTATGNRSHDAGGNSSAATGAPADEDHFDRAMLGIIVVLGVALVAALIAIVWLKRKADRGDPFYAELDTQGVRSPTI